MKFPPLKKLSIFLSTFLFLSILGIPLILWIGSGKILHPKRRPLEERHLAVITNPAEYGISLLSFEAPARDGIILKGYIVDPAVHPGAAVRTRRMRERLEKGGVPGSGAPRGTVILLHGRGGLKEDMLTVAQRFVAADFRCIVYDARAHGVSGGEICTYGKLECHDMSSVLDRGAEILAGKGESLGPVMAFGNSLGSAVMLQAIPGEPRIIAGVATAPFAEMKEVVVHAIGNVTSQRIPFGMRGVFVDCACWRGGFQPGEISPERSAQEISIPVFVAHGGRDKVIPIEQARRVFGNLRCKNCRWQEVPEAYHYNILAEGGDDLYEAMIHFYLEAISSPARS